MRGTDILNKTFVVLDETFFHFVTVTKYLCKWGLRTPVETKGTLVFKNDLTALTAITSPRLRVVLNSVKHTTVGHYIVVWPASSKHGWTEMLLEMQICLLVAVTKKHIGTFGIAIKVRFSISGVWCETSFTLVEDLYEVSLFTGGNFIRRLNALVDLNKPWN